MVHRYKISLFLIIIILLLSMFASGCTVAAQSVVTATSVSLTTGDISTAIEGSGTVSASESIAYSLPIKSKMESIYVREGSMVQEGDLLYSVDTDTFLNELITFESTFHRSLEYSDGIYKIMTVQSPTSGWVRMLKAEEGTDVLSLSATDSLCVIVTRDSMTVEIANDTLRMRDEVVLKLANTEEKGSVIRVNEATNTSVRSVVIELTKSYYEYGTEVRVYSSDSSTYLGKDNLKYKDKKAIYMTEGIVSGVYVKEGQYVERGEKLFSILIPSTDLRTNLCKIVSVADGRVKQLAVQAGDEVSDVMDENDQLTVISTAGTMYTDIESSNLSAGDTAIVKIGDNTENGTVISVTGDKVRIEIPDDVYNVGAAAEVVYSGQTVGKGSLKLTEYVSIYAPNGEITVVGVEENDTVQEGEYLFTVASPSRKIAANYAAIEDLYKEMAQINDYEMNGAVYAEKEGLVGAVNYSEGSTAEALETVLSVFPTESYQVDMSLDISYLEDISLGQKVKAAFANGITLTGGISHIDYNADSDYFSLTVSLDDCDEIKDGLILPGMTADVSIIISESLNTQLLPVGAIYSSNQGYYVFVEGDATGQGQPVYIETGLMDSQYVEVLSGLEAADKVMIYD